MKKPDTLPPPHSGRRRTVTMKAPCLSLSALVVLAVILGAAGGVSAAGTGTKPVPATQVFLRDMEDIPLMAGLTERPAAGVVFETAAGRIVEAEADSPPAARLTADRVMDFYRATLESLGWRPLGSGRFAREDEILSIFTGPAAGGLRVRFSLRPK